MVALKSIIETAVLIVVELELVLLSVVLVDDVVY